MLRGSDSLTYCILGTGMRTGSFPCGLDCHLGHVVYSSLVCMCCPIFPPFSLFVILPSVISLSHPSLLFLSIPHFLIAYLSSFFLDCIVAHSLSLSPIYSCIFKDFACLLLLTALVSPFILIKFCYCELLP